MSGDDDMVNGDRRFDRGLRSAVTLTPASAANKRRGSSHDDDMRNGCRRRFASRIPRRSDRSGSGQDGWGRGKPSYAPGERRRLRLDDWFLAVQLLLTWDDQKTISAEHMEDFLKKFLEGEAKAKTNITPRPSSEIFCRGLLRTLWDIDRLLRQANPGEELKSFTATSPMLLSVLRVMTYEFMWMPTSTVRMAQQSANDLMERCNVGKSDRDWASGAVSRVRSTFMQAHTDWERKRRAREERKRREREEQDAAATGNGAGSVPAARPKGAGVPTTQPRRRNVAAPAPPQQAKTPPEAPTTSTTSPTPNQAATGGATGGEKEVQENGTKAAVRGQAAPAAEEDAENDEEQEEEEEEEDCDAAEEEEEEQAEPELEDEEEEEEDEEEEGDQEAVADAEPEEEQDAAAEDEEEESSEEEAEEEEDEDREVTAQAANDTSEALPAEAAEAPKDAAAAEADGSKARAGPR